MKIYDGFQFFNELELLEIRFNELYDVVDHFVIVESTKTHQNNPKPLHFWENRDKFSPFLDKVIHHVFDPKECPYPWYIENEQRNQIKNSKFSPRDEDFVIISDADEIPKKETISLIKQNCPLEPSTMVMQMSYNYINCIVEEPSDVAGWRGSVVLPARHFRENSPNSFRDKKDFLPRIENAGWHLSFMGGPEKIKDKITSYAHSEFNTKELTNIDLIKEKINALSDPLSRGYIKLRLENDKSKFPTSSLKFKNLFA